MGDAGVCQQALDAGLYECQDVSTYNSQNGNGPDYRHPVRLSLAQHNIEDARESNEGSGLCTYRHEGCYGCRRAIIDIGRPRLEGYRRNLEAEADDKQTHCNQEKRVRLKWQGSGGMRDCRGYMFK